MIKADLPLITIGVTCYNAEETIGRAVESALAQDWAHKEIIVVDDCSTDGSVAVVERLAANHKSIRLICHATNGGPAAARQTISSNAKGDFVSFFDDDDESLPARVRSQYERLVSYERESGAALVACYASGRRLYPNGYHVDLRAIGSQSVVPQGSDLAAYLLFYKKHKTWFYGNGTPSCSLMARKSVFEAVGGFDPALRRVEDVDFAIRLALTGGHFIGTTEQLFIQHSTQGGDKAPDKNLAAEQALADKYQDYLQSVGFYDYARHWPLVRYYHFCGRYGKMVEVLLHLFASYPLKTVSHFFDTGPRRLIHEWKMNKERKA